MRRANGLPVADTGNKGKTGIYRFATRVYWLMPSFLEGLTTVGDFIIIYFSQDRLLQTKKPMYLPAPLTIPAGSIKIVSNPEWAYAYLNKVSVRGAVAANSPAT